MKPLLIFIALTCVFTTHAQFLNKKEQKAYKRYIATQHIDTLKSRGAILHRLQTGSNTFRALEHYGKDKAIAKRKKKLRITNLEIVKEYQDYFDFCPVYFFYSDDIYRIMKGEVSGLLLDSNLSRDTSIVPSNTHMYIAKFSNIDLLYSRPAKRDSVSPVTFKRISNRYCLNLSDQEQLNVFNEPFPYHSSSISGLNDSLHRFYKKSQKPLSRRKKQRLDEVLKKIGADYDGLGFE